MCSATAESQLHLISAHNNKHSICFSIASFTAVNWAAPAIDLLRTSDLNSCGDDTCLQPTRDKRPSPPEIDPQLLSVQETW